MLTRGGRPPGSGPAEASAPSAAVPPTAGAPSAAAPSATDRDDSTSEGTRARSSAAEAALATLFQEQAPRVFRMLLRLGVAERDVEDLCQEVFVVAHRSWESFRGEAKRGTWVCGIAVRLAANYRRLARVRHERLGVEHAPPLHVPAGQEVGIARSETRAVLHRLLDDLPEGPREVLVLYELEELGMPEIAGMLGIPLQTGYSRLHAARRGLRTAVTRASERGEL